MASTSVPKFLAVRFRAFWNSSPPIPALTTEFQSISEIRPAAIACESWYMAEAACEADEPDAAARLAIPLIEATAVSRSTPAAVNVPMFWIEFIWSSYSLRPVVTP